MTTPLTMRTFLLSILLSAGLAAPAASWYVKADASGANNGTSWTDAWTNLSTLNWTSISGGDTILLSGGTTGLHYNGFTFGKSGGSTSSPVTIKHAQIAGHSGIATINAPRVHIGNQTNVTLNGALDDNFQVPVSVADLWQITNNIGIHIRCTNDHAIFALRFIGVKLLWLDIGYSGIQGAGTGTTNKISNDPGIQLSGSSSPAEYRNSEIAYCYIHHNGIDGINNNGAVIPHEEWDLLRIHHNVIFNNVDDGVQIGTSGWTVDHNIIGGKWDQYLSGHPDMVQHTFSTNSHSKVYNNIMYNTWNAWLYTTLTAVEGGSFGHYHFFGNLCYMDRDWVGTTKMNYGIHFAGWGDGTNINHSTMTNVIFAHNTGYYCKGEGLGIYNSDDKAGQALWTWTPDGVWVVNNLLIDLAYNPSYADGSLRFGSDTNTIYNTNNFVLAGNLLGGYNQRLSFAEHTLTNEVQFVAYTGYSNYQAGSSQVVVSTNSYDFRLPSSDTLARNRGWNTAALTNEIPELMTDLYGNPRFADGAPDIGSHEYTATPADNLVLHWDFENNFTVNGYVTDLTGLGNIGLNFGRCDNQTNWPSVVTVTNGSQVSQAADIRYYWDGYGEYLRSGEYMGITNLTLSATQSNVTLLVWAQYLAENGIGTGGDGDYRDENNAAIVDSGIYRLAGGWTLGHENFWAGAISNRFTKLEIWHGGDQTNRTQYVYPDYMDTDGSTDAMHQYGFTFNAGETVLYFDGVPISTNSDPQTSLNFKSWPKWIGVGGGPHHGSVTSDPWLTNSVCAEPTYDEYPNWRWLAGRVDNLRIYSTNLSADQISAIYAAESAGSTPPPAPSSGVTMRVGQILNHRP